MRREAKVWIHMNIFKVALSGLQPLHLDALILILYYMILILYLYYILYLY